MHSLISKYFFQKQGYIVGTKLQYFDSRVCELVIKEMTRLGKFSIPIHDSWQCKIYDIDTLQKVIQDSFKQILLDDGINIPVKLILDLKLWEGFNKQYMLNEDYSEHIDNNLEERYSNWLNDNSIQFNQLTLS